MAKNKKCIHCGARNRVDARKCAKCGEGFENLRSGFVGKSVWGVSDALDDETGLKADPEKFWRVLLVLGIIFTVTFFLAGFGLPFLAAGIYGSKKGIEDSKLSVKLAVIGGSVVLGIIYYQFLLLPLFGY